MMLIPEKIVHLPDNIALAEDEAHIWQLASTFNSEFINPLKDILSIDELQRAQQFIFEKDQNRFILARGMLRYIISRYSKREPSEIIFAQSQYGKPYIVNEDCSIEFNVSHSHELILIAITNNNPVGVDIEYMRENINPDAIAQRFFSEQEFHLLRILQGKAKINLFFKLWSKKEAIIKMLGKGLYHALDEVEVDSSTHYFIHELFPMENYAAAICTERMVNNIQYLTT